VKNSGTGLRAGVSAKPKDPRDKDYLDLVEPAYLAFDGKGRVTSVVNLKFLSFRRERFQELQIQEPH